MEERETYTASETAKILKLSTRRVRQLAETEEIEGTRDAEGNWKLDKASVHAFRDDRRSSRPREGPRRRSKRPDSSTAWDSVTELERALGRLEGEMRARAELTATTESTLRESLERERERADRLEERTEQLRGELAAERSKGFWQKW